MHAALAIGFLEGGFETRFHAEPERRGRILEATTGLRSRIASKKSPESSAEDLQIALDEGITTPATVVAQLSPDDRVRFLDAQMLWAFIIEPGYGTGERSLETYFSLLDQLPRLV